MSNKDDGSTFLKRKTYPAMLSWREEGDLLRLYLGCYVTDKEFAHALPDFCEENKIAVAQVGSLVHWWQLKFADEPMPDDMRQYVENVGTFAATWKLDRLSTYRGHDAVMWWCWLNQTYPGTNVKQFVTGATCGGFVPSVGEKVVQKVVQKDPGGNEVEYEGYDIRPPTIRISIESPWEAEGESPAAIYERLMRDCAEQITAQVTRWYHEFDAGGYTFGDTKDKLTTHVNWLYQRVVDGKSCDFIACKASQERDSDAEDAKWLTESAVRKATDRVARKIGISIPKPRANTDKSTHT